MTAPVTRRKKKTGRKKAKIDPAVVEGMAQVGATNQEIADFVGCSEGTVRQRFHDLLVKARASMRLRLRQAQYKAALKGDRTMLIWLGKQVLEQREPPIAVTGEAGAPLVPPGRLGPEEIAAAVAAVLAGARPRGVRAQRR